MKYQKFDNYFVFDENPELRVYVREEKIQDYIHDVTEQKKRSESCHYVHKETGVKKKNIDFDQDDYDDYEFTCTYDYKSKLSKASYGGKDKHCTYDRDDKEMEKLANCYFFNKTSEEYDKQEEEWKAKRLEQQRKMPMLHNLIMVAGRAPYYVNDDGEEITIEEHMRLMKEQLGDDCFEYADSLISEEAKQFAKKFLENSVEDNTDYNKPVSLKDWD